MAYTLHLDESVEAGVHRIAREQIEKAIGELENTELDHHETVHQVRKRCKKLRGLLRLIRPVFPFFKYENKWLRDSSRELSYLRDSQSMLECLEALSNYYRAHVNSETFKVTRCELEQRRERIAGDGSRLEVKLERFRADILAAFERVNSWNIDAGGFTAVEGGFLKTYRRGRKTLAAAYDAPSSANFHQWRKRVKYHWYHTRLLHELWPEMLTVHCEAASDLSDILGDEHDLSVLQQTLLEDAKLGSKSTAVQVIQKLIDQRRKELQTQARIIGLLIYAEKPKQFTARLRCYWDIAKSSEEMTLH